MNGVFETILRTDLKLTADRLSPDTSLDDAGVDSVAIVELSLLLGERLGVDLSDAEIKRAATLGDLDHLIEQRQER